MQGARAVQRSIIESYSGDDTSVSIVWINILEGDTELAAKQSAGEFSPDPRVCHFYDPEKRAGKAIARGLGGEEDKVAWDIYLFYEQEAEWNETPPLPTDWMHQLTGSSWADVARYHTGDDLVEELAKSLKKLAGLET